MRTKKGNRSKRFANICPVNFRAIERLQNGCEQTDSYTLFRLIKGRFMDRIFLGLAYLGLFSAVSLSAVGSIIGCARSGIAAIGAMLETEGGHGKFLGVAALPSTHAILGIVLMFILQQKLTAPNGAGIFAIGLLSGVALLMCGTYQGNCCAMAINVSKSKPEIFGKSLAPAGIVEGFAVFVFVMALVLSQSLTGQ